MCDTDINSGVAAMFWGILHVLFLTNPDAVWSCMVCRIKFLLSSTKLSYGKQTPKTSRPISKVLYGVGGDFVLPRMDSVCLC